MSLSRKETISSFELGGIISAGSSSSISISSGYFKGASLVN